MKAVSCCGALLGALLSAYSCAQEPHLLYERALQLPASASGQACAVLDTTVLAHAGSSSLTDLRVYAGKSGSPDLETPFAFLESGRSSAEAQPATLGSVAVHDGVLSFDLAMPSRPYNQVDLELDVKNFVGIAQVAAYDGRRNPVSLGSFPVFDLSERGLARSTSIHLPQTQSPDLHIDLRLTDLSGVPLSNLSRSAILGATVPLGRVHQTQYTTIASSPVQTQDDSAFASFIVPEHVPVERVDVVLAGVSPAEFLREMTVTANPVENGRDALGAAEGVSGHIFRVDGIPGLPQLPIHSERLYMDTALGANLRSPAKVTVTVAGDSSAPLPIASIELKMHRRMVCFDAQPRSSYILRYGDPSLPAPTYAYAQKFVPVASPVPVSLGPEQTSAHVLARPARAQRQTTQFFWIVLLALVSVAGVLGLQFVRHKHEGTR